MAWKNLYKTFKQYLGEFCVITSAPSLYKSIMRAFHWYESGDLINPDTGDKYKDETSDEKWVRKYTVAYTFKCLRGLGPKSLAVLVERITNGLDFDGNYTSLEKKDETPKVYLGQPRPKNKFTSSLKEWTDRRKAKNAVIRFFNKRWAGQIWEDEDVNIDEWRKFKFDVGFNACHMDELIRRGTKKYLSKFMKVSDTPKREQEPPPEAFSAELIRVLKKEKTFARRPSCFHQCPCTGLPGSCPRSPRPRTGRYHSTLIPRKTAGTGRRWTHGRCHSRAGFWISVAWTSLWSKRMLRLTQHWESVTWRL